MILDITLLDNPLRDWLTVFAVALTINVAIGAIKWVILNRLSRLARNTQSRVDDSLVFVARATRQWLVLGVTLSVATRLLNLPERVVDVFTITATVALFLQIGMWLNAGIGFWLERYKSRTLATDAGAATSLAALGFVSRIVLWSALVLVTLDNLGVDVTALVAGLGVGGIAVALAVQNILGDLFASLSIVIDKPFVLGDFVVVDTLSGTVEHVGLKTTRIRSLSGEQIIFSNSDLLKTRIRNYKRMYERRIPFTFGVLYQTTPAQLEAIPAMVREVIDATPNTRFDRAHFLKFGDSSLDFEVIYWVTSSDYTDYMDAQQAINLALVRRFAAAGIDFAYPTRTLFIEHGGAVPGPEAA
ncbi:mechanosensitive ion channel family protein [Flagellatimonas centrodinii]|uniref:mechanosensitive ion channel family protein n=1 Tax=Flagellatimonas centrodinii TaxID=2806210 RepID=UPI001FFCB1A4|nr:mechanosensitive ion channel family protein [Flagellatimonas centrodinii]ULQ48070.1 mechanosensitive ion channel family protein [Flagellatimonas centrodinii]